MVQCFFPCEARHQESALVSSVLKGMHLRPSYFIPQELKPLENPDPWIWDHYERVDIDANCTLSSLFLKCTQGAVLPRALLDTGCVRKIALRQQIFWHLHALNTFPKAPVAGHPYLAVSKFPRTKVFILFCLESQRSSIKLEKDRDCWQIRNGKIDWFQAKETVPKGTARQLLQVPKKGHSL